MIDREVVHSKLTHIKEYLTELEPLLDLPDQNILDDYTKLRTVERNFQLIVDTMISVNSHIIANQPLVPPDDYQGTFVTLAQHKILPSDFAMKIAPVVGVRNMIVHAYDKLDRKQFIHNLKKHRHQFQKYISLITHYIKQTSRH